MIGHALVELRRRAGLTQEALAERAGISVRGLRKLESGLVAGPRRTTLELLADALELSGHVRSDFLSGMAHSAERGTGEGAVRVARQLPPRLVSFVGRTKEVEILNDAVATASSGSAASTCVVAMSGLPGIGKTALAVEWGHRAAPTFPDGQLYLNLRGFDAKNEPLTPDEALRVLLTSLGVAEAGICHGLDARIGQYRTLVSAMRILIILDNVVDPDQVRPLIPSGAGSAALVVSRHRLPGLVAEVGAVPVTLGVLLPEESRELILQRLPPGTRSVEARTAELQPLVDMCSGLPLALALIASRAQLDPEMICEYAAMIRPAGQRLSVLATSDGSTSFEDLLLGSLDGLSEDAQRGFLHLGLGVSSEFSLAELASLCGCGRAAARRLVNELLDASLVQAAGGGRLALHDLIWEFVTERARSVISPDEASRCRKRLLDYLIQGSVAATAKFAPYRKRPALPDPTDGIVVETFASADDARDWMATMLGTALAAVGHAEEWGFAREAAWLAEGISAYLDIQGRWEDLATAAMAALRAGESLNDPQIQALAFRRLAIAQGRTGELELAAQSLRRVLGFYSDCGDEEGEAYAHRLLGNILNELGQQVAALEHRRQALRLFETSGDEGAQARALNAVGWSHAQLGDFMVALDYCSRSAEMADLLKHSRSVAAAWDSIGFIKHATRDFEGADEAYERSLTAWRDTGERYYEAGTLVRLGELRVDSGDQRGAVEALRSALMFYEELGLPQADCVRTRLSDLGDRSGSAPRPEGADAECASNGVDR